MLERSVEIVGVAAELLREQTSARPQAIVGLDPGTLRWRQLVSAHTMSVAHAAHDVSRSASRR
ncbi:MAG: hypothetical protein KF819_07960 [Labilithrix sp.]|nr:hypothetical protein [Labilithrix sp.]